MGKLLLLILLITVFKCNGQFPGFLPAAQHQAKGVLDIGTSLLGGISSIGLNFGGQFGFNGQKRPNHDNNYGNRPQPNPEDVEPGNENQPYQDSYRPPNHYGQHSHRPQNPAQRPPSYNEYPHRPQSKPHHGRPGGSGSGYGNHGQYQGYPNQYGNENYNNKPHNDYNGERPGHNHNQYPEGNFNNNGYYGNNPNNQNYGNKPGYNQDSFNNNGRPNSEFQGSYGHQGYNNNNQFDQSSQGSPTDNENNQELINNINQVFGNNPNYPNSQFNSGSQNPNSGPFNAGTQSTNNEGFSPGNQKPFNNYPSFNPSELSTNPVSSFDANKMSDKNKEDFPSFIPLTPVDNKRETDPKKPAAEDEEFDIDIRVKDQ